MLKFPCFVLCVCLLGFGVASSLHGRPAVLNSYYAHRPSWWRHFSPPQRVFSLNDHRLKQDSAPQSNTHLKRIPEENINRYRENEVPRLSLEFDLSIKPYFIRSQHEKPRGNQPAGFGGSPHYGRWNQESTETSTQFGRPFYDSADDNTRRPKRKPGLSLKSSIGGLTLQLRIEDVNQIWGYAGEDITENPVKTTDTTQNETNLDTDKPNVSGDNEKTTRDKNIVTSSSSASDSKTESSIAETTFNIDKWLQNETIDLNSSSEGSSFEQFLINRTASDDNQRGSNGTEQKYTIDKSYLQYGLKEFNEWLEEQRKIAESTTQKVNNEDNANDLSIKDFDAWLARQPETETIKPLTTPNYAHSGNTNPSKFEDEEWIQSLFIVPENVTTTHSYYEDGEEVKYPGQKQTDVDERLGLIVESTGGKTTTKRFYEGSDSDVYVFSD